MNTYHWNHKGQILIIRFRHYFEIFLVISQPKHSDSVIYENHCLTKKPKLGDKLQT